jgi:hypothetical protein
VVEGKVYKHKKKMDGGTKTKNVPKQKLRSRLKKGKKINSTCQPPW